MEKLLFILLTPFLYLVQGNSYPSPITPEINPCIEDKKWYMHEIRAIQDNKNYYYRKDNPYAGNMNFDNDYILFQKGGSGLYHQSDGKEYKVTWNRNEKKDNTVEYTIYSFRNNKDLFVTWENIEINGTILTYTEFYTHANGINSLAVCIRNADEGAVYVSK